MMTIIPKLKLALKKLNCYFQIKNTQATSSKGITINFSGQLTGYGLDVLGNQFYGSLKVPLSLQELYEGSQFHSILETVNMTTNKGIILPVDVRLSVFNRMNYNYSYSLFISSGVTGLSGYYDIKEKKDIAKDFKILAWKVQGCNLSGMGFDSISGNLQEDVINFHNFSIQVQQKRETSVSKSLKFGGIRVAGV